MDCCDGGHNPIIGSCLCMHYNTNIHTLDLPVRQEIHRAAMNYGL